MSELNLGDQFYLSVKGARGDAARVGLGQLPLTDGQRSLVRKAAGGEGQQLVLRDLVSVDVVEHGPARCLVIHHRHVRPVAHCRRNTYRKKAHTDAQEENKPRNKQMKQMKERLKLGRKEAGRIRRRKELGRKERKK